MGEWTVVVGEEALPIAARMEMVLFQAATPTRTDIHSHRTDNRRGSRTRHNKALAGMGGTEGRQCRTMVGLEVVGLKELHGADRTVGVLEAGMGSLAILNRTDGEGMVVVAVAVVVVVVVAAAAAMGVRGVTVATVRRMVTVAAHTAAAATAELVVVLPMELQEVGGVVDGDTVIYSVYIFTNALWTMNDVATRA